MITDINCEYLRQGRLKAHRFTSDVFWKDVGTQEALLNAGHFFAELEKHDNIKVASPEEIALKKGYISSAQYQRLADQCAQCDYGQYLLNLI